jgi:hypothetical protein
MNLSTVFVAYVAYDAKDVYDVARVACMARNGSALWYQLLRARARRLI